ncbi:MAG: DNA repair protein RecN [Gammaproteobacteria bacterium]|nr:DNA repair protein RecN [Gammaproteobacteria bacterium]MDE0248756.1 DNA repair protein RecN [Gammaproteobacteria bacterium]
MLIELRIRNFAVIEDLSLNLGPGLNVLTGETGAGKSIIVGALSLLLGERASSDVVRLGEARALLEAVFDLGARPGLLEEMGELGIPTEDGLVMLRREVQAEGRNRAWINGSPAMVRTLAGLGRGFVDLHGQHEHQTLLQAREQREILDAFSGAASEAGAVAEKAAECARLRRELERLRTRESELRGRADFLRYQLREIEAARLQAGEDDRIENELRRLEHAEELARDAARVHAILYGGDGAVSEALAIARDLLERIARVDPDACAMQEEIGELYHAAVDLGERARSYVAGVEISPARAEELRQRSDLLFRLKRKYGPGLSDVLETHGRIAGEVAELENAGVETSRIESRIGKAEDELRALAAELTRRRTEGARQLERSVQSVLGDVGLPAARFRARIEPLEAPGQAGAERIRFFASLNPGFGLQPLAQVASGGELSRIMLALKSILAREDRVPTLVFDEIDAGIGGRIAREVGQKLSEVAAHHQVFVVTHLPQLAARGERHLLVRKKGAGGTTCATVEPLEGQSRIREIARMLGGDPESERSRAHARELLAGE